MWAFRPQPNLSNQLGGFLFFSMACNMGLRGWTPIWRSSSISQLGLRAGLAALAGGLPIVTQFGVSARFPNLGSAVGLTVLVRSPGWPRAACGRLGAQLSPLQPRRRPVRRVAHVQRPTYYGRLPVLCTARDAECAAAAIGCPRGRCTSTAPRSSLQRSRRSCSPLRCRCSQHLLPPTAAASRRHSHYPRA